METRGAANSCFFMALTYIAIFAGVCIGLGFLIGYLIK